MSRPDEVFASAPQYDPHPEGQTPLVCVDCINLGERLEQFPGSPEKIVPKVVLVFQSGETNREGKLHEVSLEMSLSMGKKAKLRAILEAWRGKSYTDEQAQKVPLHKLVGTACLASIEHKTSASGRTYAAIKTIAPLPKGMSAPALPQWERPDFYASRADGYAEEVADYLNKINPPTSSTLADMPAALAEENDDLPF